MNSRLISRDPFARTELHRTNCYTRNFGCDWCGSWKRTRSGRLYLYSYHVEHDSGRHEGRSHRHFCSVDCYRSFSA